MNIEKLTIQNFRNFGEPKTFHLNPHFTAFIGVNGKGKSTILHALRVSVGSFFLGIPEVKKRHILEDEIHIKTTDFLEVPTFPVKVEVDGRVGSDQRLMTWRRQLLKAGSSTTSKYSDVGNVREAGLEKYKLVTEELNDNVDLPVISFFGIRRGVGAGRVSKKSRVQRLGRRIFKEGYQDWDDMKASVFHYREWLGTYDLLVEQRKEYSGTREAFFDTIMKANPFVKDVRFYNNELWVKVDVDNNVSDLLPIVLHSDGIRYFTEMVAEIAYRCIVLNGYKKENAIKESTGIIMIDELDLHLHPTWQRHVVSDLKKAFPKMQFVVTTHSPFIVQSLKADELVILDEAINKEGDPFKKSLEEVAAIEMGVEDIPRSQEFMEMQKVAEEYFSLIKEGQTSENNDQVKKLRGRLNELEERFSEDAAFVAALKIERKASRL